jgi:voltage-gated potassium channel
MNPDIVEFMERLSVDGSSSINLEEIKLSEITGNEESCSLADLHIRHKTGCTVIGIKDPDGNYTINPDSDHNLRANSRLFVLGRKEQIAQLGLLLNGPRKN